MSPAATNILDATRDLSAALTGFTPGGDAAVTYNPLEYARRGWERYVELFAGRASNPIVFLGMNPGPWGMAQTGVPFGEIEAVRHWMGIDVVIDKPENEHPKRPVEGLACTRSEVSGRRLWGLMRDRFTDAATFFADHFVLNYCPLVFMAESGRNVTPDKLPAAARDRLYAICDEHLKRQLTALNPRALVGVGAFAETRLRAVIRDTSLPEPVRILHPSPASPAANRGWAPAATESMVHHRLWTP